MILFLTNADTELLTLRAIAEALPEGFPPLRAANPHRLASAPELDGVELVLVRLLGGRAAWRDPFDRLVEACAAGGVPLLAFGGEASLDDELARTSSVELPVLLQAFGYLVQGGAGNLEQLLRFVADAVLGGEFGHAPALAVPSHGFLGSRERLSGRPTLAVLFYRAHLVAGNTRFVDELCDAIEAEGANACPLYCYSLRTIDADESGESVLDLLRSAKVDAVVTTVLAAGSLIAEANAWDPGALATLDVPVIQAICSTSASEEWAESRRGL